MAARRLWGGQALLMTLAAAVLAATAPAVPRASAAAALAIVGWAAAGAGLALLLCLLVTPPNGGRERGARGGAHDRRARPVQRARILGRARAAHHRRSVRWATAGAVALAAACEEAVWRGGVLAGLAGPLGEPAALAASAAGFGLVHGPSRRRVALHVLTGLVFGGAYLAGGGVAGAAAAHVAYNLVLLAGARRATAARRPRSEAAGGAGA